MDKIRTVEGEDRVLGEMNKNNELNEEKDAELEVTESHDPRPVEEQVSILPWIEASRA